MEQAFPFDAVITDGVPDRSYSAEDLANVFNTIFSGGVLAEGSLKVRPAQDGSFAVQLGAGSALLRGYHYSATDVHQFTLEAAPPGGHSRVDLVVLRLDLENRTVYPALLTGAAAVSPAAPSLTRDSAVFEMALGEIYISSGKTKIFQSDITDTRVFNRLRTA